MKRLRNFLVNEELDPENVDQDKTMEGAIKIENATFRWDKEEETPTIKEYVKVLALPSLTNISCVQDLFYSPKEINVVFHITSL